MSTHHEIIFYCNHLIPCNLHDNVFLASLVWSYISAFYFTFLWSNMYRKTTVIFLYNCCLMQNSNQIINGWQSLTYTSVTGKPIAPAKLYLRYGLVHSQTTQGSLTCEFLANPYPGYSLATIYVCQTIPWIQFGYNLYIYAKPYPIWYGLAATPGATSNVVEQNSDTSV